MIDGRTVKSVIKILALTFTIPLVACLLIELFNTALTPVYMRGIINKAVEESCGYFAQETYRTDDDTAVFKDTYDIMFSARDSGGSGRAVAVSGDFFEHSTQDEIYKDIYFSPDFRDFLYGDSFELIGSGTSERTTKEGLWVNLDRLACGIANQTAWGIPQRNLGTEYKSTGRTYVDSNVTALNLGVTYLDKDIIERIAKWNMVANLYRGDNEMIHRHDGSITGATEEDRELYDYVMYDGYKIYYNTFEITDINYTVYDLATENGRDEFSRVVHVGENNDEYWGELDLSSDDERRYVCVAQVDYSMDIGYDGITPIKNVIKYLAARTQDVYGIGGAGPNDNTFYFSHANIDRASITTLESDEEGYDLNGYNNRVYYYIVR